MIFFIIGSNLKGQKDTQSKILKANLKYKFPIWVGTTNAIQKEIKESFTLQVEESNQTELDNFKNKTYEFMTQSS